MADATVGVMRGFIVMVSVFYERVFRTSPLHTEELLLGNPPSMNSACTSLSSDLDLQIDARSQVWVIGQSSEVITVMLLVLAWS